MIYKSNDPESTLRVAREIAYKQPDCPAYYLEGELGAGKTLFTKGLAAFYGIDPLTVVSPTFTLVNRYGGGNRIMYHVDLYRIENSLELFELGLEEIETDQGAIMVVEWAEKLETAQRLPDSIVISFEVNGPDQRIIKTNSSINNQLRGTNG